MTQDEMRLTPEYRAFREAGWQSCVDAEEALDRELTAAEDLAVWDNKQDQVLVDMGR